MMPPTGHGNGNNPDHNHDDNENPSGDRENRDSRWQELSPDVYASPDGSGVIDLSAARQRQAGNDADTDPDADSDADSDFGALDVPDEVDAFDVEFDEEEPESADGSATAIHGVIATA